MDILFCPMCGTKLISEARFCANCGAAIHQFEKTEPVAPVQVHEEKAEEQQLQEPQVQAEPVAVEDTVCAAVQEESPEPVQEEPAQEIPEPIIPVVQPEPKPEPKPAPAPKKKAASAKRGVGGTSKAVLLCVVIFLLGTIALTLLSLRLSTGTEQLVRSADAVMEDVDLADIEIGAIVPDAEDDLTVAQWLAAEITRFYQSNVEIKESRVEKYLEETNLVQVICEKAGLLLEDIYNDANKNKLELEDIQDILYEEAELMEDTMHIPISRMDVYTISMELEESKVMDLLEARTLRKQEPAVYFGLQYGLSYVTIGVFLVLTLVMMVLLAKSNRWNVMRTVKDLGVTLTVLGVVLLLLVVAPVVLPVILSGVEGAQLIGIAAKVVFAGFRMPCLVTLMTGIVLLVISKVAKKLADRKAAA